MCSEDIQQEIFREKVPALNLAAQKFHRLLCRGLSSFSPEVELECLSVFPSTNRKVVYSRKEKKNEIAYHYLGYLNIPIVKHLQIVFMTFAIMCAWWLRNRKKQKILICDLLNCSLSSSALLFAKLFHVKVVTIITDLPKMLSMFRVHEEQVSKLAKTASVISEKLMSYYDGYVLLTEQMNSWANPRQHPYIIIEGIADHCTAPAIPEETFGNKKNIIYAGGLFSTYGVTELLWGFMAAPELDLELHLYGQGPLTTDFIPDCCQKDQRIKYWGVVDNQVIMQHLRKAFLIVNPRSASGEFTKYSFPSKNMEAMSSGVPFLAVKLPGIPNEYQPFFYTLKEATVDNIQLMLRKIYAESPEKRQAMGRAARQFVLTQKNEKVQAEKLLTLIAKILDNKKK